MTSPAIPAALSAFLDRHLPLLDRPPEADAIYDWARMCGTTEEVVWQAVRARMPAAPTSPPAPTWIVPLDQPFVEARPFDAQHPFDRVLSALRARGCRILPKRDQRGREAKRATCPAHDDRNPSLVVTADGPNVLLHCFGGCPTARVVAALDLKLADLFSGPPQAQVPRPRRAKVVKPTAAPKLSPDERLARKRMLTADRTRRWRERRQAVEPVTLSTHSNIRSVTCDAVTLCDAPNVLPVTSHDESSFTPSDLVAMTPTREEDPTVMEFEVEIHPGGDDDGGDDGDWARA